LKQREKERIIFLIGDLDKSNDSEYIQHRGGTPHLF